MKKWMIPVFAVGGVATVGAAVLGGMLIFGDKPGMKSPEEVAVRTVQTWLVDGDYEEYVSLVRHPMIKEEIYQKPQQNTPTSTGGEMNAGICLYFL